jgi:hypothetical protein
MRAPGKEWKGYAQGLWWLWWKVNDLSGIVKALFVQYDTDHDGLLSVTEFVPLAEALPELGS